MKKCNLLIVFDSTMTFILFCKRQKNPYKGKYNFVGGKIETKDSYAEAYRELLEETGISSDEIILHHFMDMVFHTPNDFLLELFVGQLEKEVVLVPELHPLEWHPITNDFYSDTYAVKGQIGFIIEEAKYYLSLL